MIEHYENEAGGLGVLHFENLPFVPVRAYWLHGTHSGLDRGLHAHKTLHQYVFCVNGVVIVELNDGKTLSRHSLSVNSNGLYIHPGQWRRITCSDETSVLFVLASSPYDEDDYIHDYEEFRSWLTRQK